jgi:threonine synthase
MAPLTSYAFVPHAVTGQVLVPYTLRHAMWSYLSDLECTGCTERWPAGAPHGLCPRCGKVLFARYDLAGAARELTREAVGERPWTLWRYHELLPVARHASVVSLGEGATPLVGLNPPPEWGFRGGQIQVKDEGSNPTGSFKARGLAVAISRAVELGATHLCLASAGNAGAAAAAYGSAAGASVHVAVPADVPDVNRRELAAYGADVILVDGLIDAAGARIRELAAERGWFDLSTLREPYRAEGKKTMGFELAEQGGFGDGALPDVIVYPAGGGTGVVGMWKAFDELQALGWIGERRPRMVIVQADGCQPLVRAFERGATHAEPWEGAATQAAGIRVPSAIGDYLILEALYASGGAAVSVSDEQMRQAQREMASRHGLWVSLEAAATYASVPGLLASGVLDGSERVVLFATANGAK